MVLPARSMSAKELLAYYCAQLYGELGTYEAVARQSGLDRRTVKKYSESTGADPLGRR